MLVGLCELLGQVELYTILSPLEHLYAHPAAEVRLAVVLALERFMYKRSFVTVRAALKDDDIGVRQQAYKTVEALRFQHAFDPLARIFREADDPGARTAAIRAIARIDTMEAAELLLGVFQHEGQRERDAALEELKRAKGYMFVEAARQALPALGEDVRQQLQAIFQARGEVL
jgi:HEAT repeat protein